MPTPQLEQHKLCNWIESPDIEDRLTSQRNSLVGTVASRLEVNTKDAFRVETYPWLLFGLRCARDEAGSEQDVWDLARAVRVKFTREERNSAADALASQLRITRSQLYSKALADFIERYENEKLTEELNQAYADVDQEEDLAFLRQATRHYDPRLADEG